MVISLPRLLRKRAMFLFVYTFKHFFRRNIFKIPFLYLKFHQKEQGAGSENGIPL